MQVAIIGSNEETATNKQIEFAFDIGRALIDHGHTIINGGMGGIMEASARGAHSSNQYERYKLIAILPLDHRQGGNAYSGIKIATHLGYARNRLIILNADAVLAIGGGTGTLNEMTIAWELGLPLAGYTQAGGWSANLAGKMLDNRREEKIHPVSDVEDVLNWLNTYEG